MATPMEPLYSFMLDNYRNSSESLAEFPLCSHAAAFQLQDNQFSIGMAKKRRLQLMRKLRVGPFTASLVKYDKPTVMETVAEKTAVEIKMTALVTVRNDKVELLEKMIQWFDDYNHPSQTEGSVVFQLVSSDLDPWTLQPKLSRETVLQWSKNCRNNGNKIETYKVEFVVDSSFGMPGAVILSNQYQKEFYLESFAIEGAGQFACNSWIQPRVIDDQKRIFFTNKAYLPHQTPSGLKILREVELANLRGSGKGIRKFTERVYDFDLYNDLGNPEKSIEYARPILGGENLPYPRRCRTGRPLNTTETDTESPANSSIPMYVPRDEAFQESKRKSMDDGKWKSLRKNLIPILRNVPLNCNTMKRFSEVNCIYKKNRPPALGVKSENELPLANIPESLQEILKFDPPEAISKDGSSFCLRDDELGRLALAGMNPLSIERLKVFPPVSKLDPSIYGPQESAIREEHIIGHLDGMSVQQALEENKLFIIDYHDAYLPFLDRINTSGNRKAYATRTIFFLTRLQTLKPVAIELSLQSASSGHPPKQVLTPPVDATTNWLWQLAKAHVSSNDAGVHQLVHHWLRTHACIEPFIIAANRQLSKMHPIFKLLHPHMRYTLNINAQAREFLINAGGIIESFFAPAKYGMEIAAAAYQNWRFDMEGLPADLIRRGMAVPDPTQACGVRLVIEDYPYASDGLLVWSAIETLVRTYVKHYYSGPSQIASDKELQAWYHECINTGHADHRNASWWPKLSTPDDLTSTLTTIIWISSAQHAAVNFGQYSYGGYVPIRPPSIRKLMPMQHDLEYEDFLKDPEMYYLSSLPSLQQATYYMSMLDILSTHEEEEEYLGDRKDLSTWLGEPQILEAFYNFSRDLKMIEKTIEKRNADSTLRNRCGAGVSSYRLLMPSSKPGISGRGVPNSVSI